MKIAFALALYFVCSMLAVVSGVAICPQVGFTWALAYMLVLIGANAAALLVNLGLFDLR